MNRMIKLASIFIKINAMSKPTDRGQKIKIAILSIFSFFCIMLPVVVGVGVLVKVMTESLQNVGCEEFSITLMLYITCVFTLVFGLNVLFSELYFAGNIEHILPWPLRAYEIVGAKFLSVFYMENIMQFMLLISCVIGYGIGSKMDIYSWIVAVIGIMFIPIMPLAYCGIVSIIVMGFTKFIRNKDIIRKISVGMSFVILLVVVFSITSIQNFDIAEAVENMATGKQTVFKVMNVIFPIISMYVNAFAKKDIFAFLAFIVANIIVFCVYLVLGELFYFKGVIGLSVIADKKKVTSIDTLLSKYKQVSPWKAYFIKEVRILTRTQSYMTNCVITNYIWPIFIYAIYKIKKFSFSLSEFRQMYINNEDNTRLIIVLMIVGISVLITALNSISSNAISREGKHFSFMKYIPVPYKVQWNVKALVGAMYATTGVMIYFIPFCIIVKIPILDTLVMILLSLLAIIVIAYMGIYIDSIQPKLIWEDALSSLRENYNTFFTMAIAIGYVLFMCFGGYVLCEYFKQSIWLVILIIFISLLVFGGLVCYFTLKNGIDNIKNQEEA